MTFLVLIPPIFVGFRLHNLHTLEVCFLVFVCFILFSVNSIWFQVESYKKNVWEDSERILRWLHSMASLFSPSSILVKLLALSNNLACGGSLCRFTGLLLYDCHGGCLSRQLRRSLQPIRSQSVVSQLSCDAWIRRHFRRLQGFSPTWIHLQPLCMQVASSKKNTSCLSKRLQWSQNRLYN